MRKILWALHFLLLVISGECNIQKFKRGVPEYVPHRSTRMCKNDTLLSPESKFPCPKATHKFTLKDTGCTFYLNCTEDNTSMADFMCNYESIFHPINKRCSQQYECPEISQILQSTFDCISINAVHESTKKCRFSVPKTGCTKYINCKRKDPGVKSVNEDEHEDDDEDDDEEITTTTIATIATTLGTQTGCYKEGKISANTTYCAQYILCVATKHGFKEEIYICMEGIGFNPQLGECDEHYKCPNTYKRNRSFPFVHCTEIGKIPDRNDPLCKYYYYCDEKSPDLIIGRLKKCEMDYRFDPEAELCTDTYICKN